MDGSLLAVERTSRLKAPGGGNRLGDPPPLGRLEANRRVVDVSLFDEGRRAARII